MFCDTEGISDIFVTCGCINLICNLLRRNRKVSEFQSIGLTALKRLIKSSEDVCKILIPETRRIMKAHPESGEIQIQCCEMIFHLAKKNYELSVQLVKDPLHQLLYEIFAKFEDNLVLNIAADCIYFLACEHNLKNAMLLEMCAAGNTSAVSLLIQLSADVNYSEEGHTPLSVACKSNNLDLVQLLLTKGVTDMDHPLTLCLEDKKRHRLAGFILKRMGHDEDAGSISLTGRNE